jgi:hypothetical protein
MVRRSLRSGVGTLAALSTLSLAGAASAQNAEENPRGGHGESCRARVDCVEGLVCVDNRCLKPGEEPPSAPPPSASGSHADLYDNEVPWRGSRLGIYYMITPPLAGNLRSMEAGHSVGIESSSRLFGELRYRATFGYAAAPGLGTVIHGMRADLLTLGYTFTAAHSSAVRFGIEPLLNLINMETYFPNAGSFFIFSSGWSIAAILGFGDGHGYLSIEPIGMDFRWLAAGSGLKTTADVGVQWRGRVSVGVAF